MTNKIAIKPKKTVANKFSLAEEYLNERYKIRFNIISLDIEIRVIDSKEWKILNENSLFIELQKEGINISINNLIALLKSDYVPEHDPFKEYFKGLPKWDGFDYIGYLASFVKAKDQEAFNNHFRKWLVRLVKTAIDDKFFNKQALIFVHDEQNSGKSTFCRFLCPPLLNNHIVENVKDDKDSRIALATNIIVNLDELASLPRNEINGLKSLFSILFVSDRLPFGKKRITIPRRCSFIGSTNENEFLHDETGSVRWLCFEIDKIDWNYKIEVDINMVYSQAYHLVKSDYNFNLTADEISENEIRNKSFQQLSEESQLVHKYFMPDESQKAENFKTATDVKVRLSIHTGNNRYSVSKIGKALKQLGAIKKKQSGIYGYYLIEKI